MRIQFRKKIYEIPDPVCAESEMTISVEKFIPFPAPKDSGEDIFRFSNSLAKFIFFLMHEGIRLTWNKVRALYFQQEIVREKKLVFAYGRVRGKNNYVIGIGPQDCPNAECYVLPKCLTLTIEKDRDILRDYDVLSQYLTENPEVLDAVYHHSPYSGRKLEIVLENILHKCGEQCSASPYPVALQSPKLTSGRPIRASSLYRRKDTTAEKYDLFLAGAGGYPCAYVLPMFKNVRHHTIVDLNPILAGVTGQKYNFEHWDTNCDRAFRRLSECANPIVIIATYHSTHLPIIEQALSYNSKARIMVEKPPVTTREQLGRLIELRKSSHFIEVGYNRRHIPFVRKAKEKTDQHQGPVTMTCIVKEKSLPLSHWYYWPDQGTRITGNLSHWVDLGVYFIQKRPVSINSVSVSEKFIADEASILVAFEDGSLLNLIASDRGNPLRGIQEHMDIRRGELTITIDDFLTMKIQEHGYEKVYRNIIRDKGHKRMYAEFMRKCNQNAEPGYPINDLLSSTRLYIEIKDALMKKQRFVELIRPSSS